MRRRRKTRDVTFRLWKRGRIVDVHFRGPSDFRPSETTRPISRARVFGVDTECLTKEGTLKTVLTTLRFADRSVAIETLDGSGMLAKLFDEVWAQNFAVREERPSRTKERRASLETRPDGTVVKHKGHGQRQAIPVILSIWFNLPFDFGRLVADSPGVLRTVAAGADSYRFKTGEYEVEVKRMFFGSASAFSWYVRRQRDKTIVNLAGVDMCGYWKTTLATAAKSVGVQEKIDIESVIDGVYEKTFESFTTNEWDLFRTYGLGDVQTHLELYHATVDLLCNVDARVIRHNGVIPPSAPGASARIMFSKAFDIHKIESWERYPAYADQLGADAYYGGRVFRARRGIFQGMRTLDLKSAYPYVESLLPDPVSVRIERVWANSPFDPDRFRGKFGVLVISGESLDDVYPPFRVHDEAHHGRLQYVSGKFTERAVTIPEIMVGVERGALRVDKIHDGCIMQGSAEKSFIRIAVLAFFAIKENASFAKALRDMAKLLAVSSYGKLIEVQEQEYMIIDRIIMPKFTARETIAASLATVYANGTIRLPKLYWGDLPSKAEAAEAAASLFFDKLCRANYQKRKAEAMPHAVIAVVAYIHGLETIGEESKGTCTVSEYLSEVKTYKAGAYFMPLYASQITGLPCAMVGAMASEFDALLGDTDSVHIVAGPTQFDKDHRFARYLGVMERAGYPSPVNDVDGNPKLGSWVDESPCPSAESILARTKLYSHRFVDKDGKITYKQAHHGLPKFYTKEIEAATRGRAFSLIEDKSEWPVVSDRDTRVKNAKMVRQIMLHAAIRDLCVIGNFAYRTRSSPRKLVEATRSGLPVGEFVSREMNASVMEDPNTWIDETGLTRWKRLEMSA